MQDSTAHVRPVAVLCAAEGAAGIWGRGIEGRPRGAREEFVLRRASRPRRATHAAKDGRRERPRGPKSPPRGPQAAEGRTKAACVPTCEPPRTQARAGQGAHLRPRVSDPMGVLMEAFLPASPAPSQPHGAHKAPEGHIVVPARRAQTGVGQIAPQAVAKVHERPGCCTSCESHRMGRTGQLPCSRFAAWWLLLGLRARST